MIRWCRMVIHRIDRSNVITTSSRADIPCVDVTIAESGEIDGRLVPTIWLSV
jgi:hypothetical protein